MPFTDILSREKDIGKNIYNHEILVKGPDFEACKTRVLHFFEKYQLVRYSQINIMQKESLPSTSPDFFKRIDKAVLENRRILHKLAGELQNEGVNTFRDVVELPQGYKTKILHVITHFLDGFFGIDTFFYNLEGDSHWVSDEIMGAIRDNPSRYWLICIEGRI